LVFTGAKAVEARTIVSETVSFQVRQSRLVHLNSQTTSTELTADNVITELTTPRTTMTECNGGEDPDQVKTRVLLPPITVIV
jgi:hypothetical protein